MNLGTDIIVSRIISTTRNVLLKVHTDTAGAHMVDWADCVVVFRDADCD